MESKKYDSLELSMYIISVARDLGLYITHIQLQKILYYIQAGYIKKFNSLAFDDNILYWTYGSVVKKVWNFFSYYGGEPLINFDSNLKIADEEKELIKEIVKDKLKINIWDLIDKTLEEIQCKIATEKGSSSINVIDMQECFSTIA